MQLMISTANDLEFALVVGFYGMIVLVVMCVITGIIETICDRIERKREKQRRACKRSGAPIRPGRRY
jgi:hypothetical protein